jgi:hypothetical protein
MHPEARWTSCGNESPHDQHGWSRTGRAGHQRVCPGIPAHEYTLSWLLAMARPHTDPACNEALEAYVKADKAAERAREAFARAEAVRQEREAELRAICERLISAPSAGQSGV